MLVSIVIRTLNEGRHLDDLLVMIGRQETRGLDHEVVLVDSGSTDDTVEIARRHNVRITTISRSEFSFGRSLNRGSDFARGDILVFISGHCVPVDERWLLTLCRPIMDGQVGYAYGRQVGDDNSKFSERRIFAKYFPEQSHIPQEGFFCNNANSAISRNLLENHCFDEELTGLEDMALAQQIIEAGHKVGYVAEATVFHYHDESWAQVRRRFEREALALQQIMPEIQLSKWDILRYIVLSVIMDWKSALHHGKPLLSLYSIVRYRVAQFGGSYAGNHHHRELSKAQKERFFYPFVGEVKSTNAERQSYRCPRPYEGQ